MIQNAVAENMNRLKQHYLNKMKARTKVNGFFHPKEELETVLDNALHIDATSRLNVTFERYTV